MRRFQCLGAAAALGIVVMTAASQAPATGAGFRLWYMLQVTETAKNHLTLDSKSGVAAIVGYTADGFPVRGLGVYHLPWTAGDADFERAVAAVRALDLNALRAAAAPPRPGMRKKIVQIERPDGKAVCQLNASNPSPPLLGDLEDSVLRLFERVAAGPLRVVAMDLDIQPSSAVVGEPVTFTIGFRNEGTFPVEFPNPAAFAKRGTQVFHLNFWSAAAGPNAEPEYEWTLDLVGKELRLSERQTLRSKDPYVRLEPGERKAVSVSMPMPKSEPNPYQVELVYIAPPPSTSGEESTRVWGEYHADARTLVVMKRK